MSGKIVHTDRRGQIVQGIELNVLDLQAVAGANTGTGESLIDGGASD